MFLSNMKNNFRGKTLRLFFYSLVNEETHKKTEEKGEKHNKIFILCGQ